MTITLVKSPLNYIGNKYKLLPQIIPLLPRNINTFIDLFGGGGDMSVNVPAKKVIYNDILSQLVDLLKNFKSNSLAEIHLRLNRLVDRYNLSSSSPNNYYIFRDAYNRDPQWDKFFLVVIHAFCRYISFNNYNEFNGAFGNKGYNDNVRGNLIEFVNRLHSIDIEFQCSDFRSTIFPPVNQNDFVYCDPPYSISNCEYTKGWSSKDDIDLLKSLDCLNKIGIRFALSNVFENKGLTNYTLKEWAKKYNVHYLDYDYSNSSYNRSNRNSRTIEVLVTNY